MNHKADKIEYIHVKLYIKCKEAYSHRKQTEPTCGWGCVERDRKA